MTQTLNVLGIPGSLREDSYNEALLRAAQEVSGASIDVEIADIGDIPRTTRTSKQWATPSRWRS